MERNLRDIELIQRYLDESLTEGERHEVEYRLKEEPILQVLYKETRQLIQGIRYNHLQSKLEQLRELEAVLPNELTPKEKSFSRFVPLSIAATIVIMVGIWFFAFRDTRPLNEKLFAQSFETFDSPGSGLTRSEDSSNETFRAKAYVAYDNADYKQAILLFKKALQTEKDDPILHLCLGNAYLATNQLELAEETFRHMLQEHEDLVTQSTWYLALTYLKQGNIERTKSTLWEISKSSTYGEKARKLLKELD
jgi:predicted Zn-dependent protease